MSELGKLVEIAKSDLLVGSKNRSALMKKLKLGIFLFLILDEILVFLFLDCYYFCDRTFIYCSRIKEKLFVEGPNPSTIQSNCCSFMFCVVAELL